MFLLVNIIFSLLYHCTYGEVCPTRVLTNFDNYNVQQRFDAVRKDNNVLRVKYTHPRRDGVDTYQYTIKLCGDVLTDVAVLQTDESKTSSVNQRIGNYKNSTLMGGEDWIFIQYMNGEHYQSHCHKKNKQAWLTLRCEDQGETPTLRMIEEARYSSIDPSVDDRMCYFMFEYNHPAVCQKKNKKLSGGSIFLIIVVSLAAAYFFFGFLYMRFVVHAKGFEQIPQYFFWQKVGNMSADGCDFVCRREEHPSTYKGMSDALDIDSSDDDKDDGLLPM